MIPFGYTLSSFSDIVKCDNKLPAVQITMNGRIFPGKRDYPRLLSTVKDVKTNIYLHYDFIYILSRYLMFKPRIQEAIKTELIQLLSLKQDNFKGIVMHTDYPISKEVISGRKTVEEYYGSRRNTFDLNIILSYLGVKEDKIVIDSILKFYEDVKFYSGSFCRRILLENTTKSNKSGVSTYNWLYNAVLHDQVLTDVFGLCFDTEHSFAVTGDFVPPIPLPLPEVGCKCLVHLNTIPAGVKPMSGIDRHSLTSIYDCSENSSEYYEDVAKAYKSKEIDSIREVKSEVMLEELSRYGI